MENKYLLITVEESDSSIGFYDFDSGLEIKRITTGFWPHEISISNDNATAYITNFGIKDYDEKIGSPGASISVVDIKNMCEVDRLYTFKNKDEYKRFRAPHGVVLSPKGDRLYVNVETEDKLLVYDLVDNDFDRNQVWSTTIDIFPNKKYDIESLPDEYIGLPKGTHSMLFSKDESSLFVVAGKNGVSEIDIASGRIVRTFYCNGAIRGLEYSIDKEKLIASASNEICIINPTTFMIEKRFGSLNSKQILYSKQSPDGKYIIAPAVWEGQVLIIDYVSGEVIRRITVGADPIHIMISPVGNSFFVTHGRSKFILEIDLESFEIKRQIKTKGGVNGIAWSNYTKIPSTKQLKFGACIPLSGPTSSEGQDLRLGYQYWQETVNNSGGLLIDNQLYEVEVVFKDSESRIDEEYIAKLTTELIKENGVQFLFGTYPSPPNEHSGKIANENKIPFITASGAAGRIYEQGYTYVFGIMSSAKAFLEGTLNLLAGIKNPPSSILFISCEDPAALQDSRTTSVIAQEQLKLQVLLPNDTTGLKIDTEQRIILFKHNETDFAQIINSISSINPDIISITGHLGESIAIVEQSSINNLSPKCFAFSVGPAMPEFTVVLGDKAEHMVGAAMWSSVQESYGHDRYITPENFSKSFFERYSKKPSYLAAGAMACGLVYEEAFRRANSIEGEVIKNELLKSNFVLELFYSKIEFDKKGLNSKRPLITIQIRKTNNEFFHIPLWPKGLAGRNEIIYPHPGWDKINNNN